MQWHRAGDKIAFFSCLGDFKCLLANIRDDGLTKGTSQSIQVSKFPPACGVFYVRSNYIVWLMLAAIMRKKGFLKIHFQRQTTLFWCVTSEPDNALLQLSRPHNNYDECSVHRNKPAVWHFVPLDALSANVLWIHGRLFEALWMRLALWALPWTKVTVIMSQTAMSDFKRVLLVRAGFRRSETASVLLISKSYPAWHALRYISDILRSKRLFQTMVRPFWSGFLWKSSIKLNGINVLKISPKK